jgi:hypothetical protein
MRHATRPWEGPQVKAAQRATVGVAKRRAGCAWPVKTRRRTGICGGPTVNGLALCARHAAILDQVAGETCAWPDCAQTRPFNSLCAYHLKRALGLLEPYRA